MGYGKPARPSPRRKHVNGPLVALLVVLLLVGAGATYLALHPVGTPPPLPTLHASIKIRNNTSEVIPSEFFGINVRADQSLGPTQAQAVNSTPVRFVRWPGGALTDRFDALAVGGYGLIYQDDGSSHPASVPSTTFVSWCESIRCQAVVALPVEIANQSYAKALASFLVTGLGFRPAYWELGNEPARWTHFGIGWSHWNLTQNATPTPAQYASAALAYAQAVRSVDPTALFLAPGGVGFGGASEATWISTAVSTLGSYLLGISIHVYPAGNSGSFLASPQLFSSLEGENGLPARVAADRAAAVSACKSCRLPIFVDEFGAQTYTAPGGFVSGYPLVPYAAAMLLQGLSSNVTSMGFWLLVSGYPAAWFDSAGNARPTFTLFSRFFTNIPPDTLPTNVTAPVAGVFAQAFASLGRVPTTLLVVNADPSANVVVDITHGPGAATALSWNESLSAPVSVPLSAATSNWTLPPLGIVRFDGSALGARVLSVNLRAYSENSGIAPGSMVPNASIVKYCLSAPTTGQMVIQGIRREAPSLPR